MVFVLVHSPLVGPGTWTLVAQELERRGVQAVVPSLLAASDAPPPQWQQCVEIVRAATTMVSSPIVLVGHSGGGLLLPAIASAVAPDVSRFIFVDSGLPATTGKTPFVPPQFVEQLGSLAVDGKLPTSSSKPSRARPIGNASRPATFSSPTPTERPQPKRALEGGA